LRSLSLEELGFGAELDGDVAEHHRPSDHRSPLPAADMPAFLAAHVMFEFLVATARLKV
jgi:hypothetical protein